MVIGMFEYIINIIIYLSVLNWLERENVIIIVIKYYCNIEDFSLYMIMIFFKYLFIYDCISVWDMYSYNYLYRLFFMWLLECCMDEGKVVNWGFVN